jgi:ADP-ribose pyrophosphatase
VLADGRGAVVMTSSEQVCANAAHIHTGVFVLRQPGSWTVLSSRDLLDASPFLKVRVETIRLPDGAPYTRLLSVGYAVFRLHPRGNSRWTRDSLQAVSSWVAANGARLSGRTSRTRRSSLEAAKRELLEETGFVSDSWVELGGYTVNANQGGAVSYMFHATSCRRIAGPCSDDLEDTVVLFLSRDELLVAITRGEIHLLTQIALVSIVWQVEIARALSK